jgi:hypothetical protein
MDELHVCILRALAIDETPRERAEHGLDLSLLDHLTWPAYAWEFLRLTEDPLAEQEWAHRLLRQKAPGNIVAAPPAPAAGGGSSGSGGKKGGKGGKKSDAAESSNPFAQVQCV